MIIIERPNLCGIAGIPKFRDRAIDFFCICLHLFISFLAIYLAIFEHTTAREFAIETQLINRRHTG